MARLLEELREHLALTFHRFIEGEAGRPLTISVNGVPLKPFDPFLRSNPATQKFAVERIPIEGEVVEVAAFTLPHHSKLRPTEKKRRDLGDGMREAQGFYIYRNLRLISHGTWAGLSRRAELSKQSRVRVDFPNSLDHLWKLDIMKSRAEPPAVLKRRLADLLGSVTGSSERVHTFRARKERELEPSARLWSRQLGRGSYWYEVNVEHPAVRALAGQLDDQQRGLLNDLFLDLAAAFPVEDLYASAAKNQMPAEQTLADEDVVERIRLLRAAGVLPEAVSAASRMLRTIEPFDRVKDIDRLISAAWEEDAHGH
jgi:hypothetical protein